METYQSSSNSTRHSPWTDQSASNAQHVTAPDNSKQPSIHLLGHRTYATRQSSDKTLDNHLFSGMSTGANYQLLDLLAPQARSGQSAHCHQQLTTQTATFVNDLYII